VNRTVIETTLKGVGGISFIDGHLKEEGKNGEQEKRSSCIDSYGASLGGKRTASRNEGRGKPGSEREWFHPFMKKGEGPEHGQPNTLTKKGGGGVSKIPPCLKRG